MIGPLRRLKLYDCHAERSRAELSEAKHACSYGAKRSMYCFSRAIRNEYFVISHNRAIQ